MPLVNACYIAIHPSGRYAVTANISGESISSFSLSNNGSLDKQVQQYDLPPTKTLKKGKMKDTTAKPHCVVFSPDGNYLFTADIGGNRVIVLKFKDGKFSTTGKDIQNHKFGGPRHLRFDASGKYLYLVNQISSTVSVFQYSGNGQLKEIQQVSSLPADYDGPTNHSADLKFHPNGKFLYVSNRLHGTIGIFSVDEENGKLKLLDTPSSGGIACWSFDIDKTGKYLIASNNNSNNLVLFEIDSSTGMLKNTGQKLSIARPSSVLFAE